MVHVPGQGYKACCSCRFCFSLGPRLSLFLRPQHSRYGSCVCGQIRFMCALMFVEKSADLFKLQLSASRSTSRRLNLSAPQQQSHTSLLKITSFSNRMRACQQAIADPHPMALLSDWWECENTPAKPQDSFTPTSNQSNSLLMLMRRAVGHWQQARHYTAAASQSIIV